MANSMVVSPAIKSVSTESIQDLFSRDPEDYGKQNLEDVIAYMRALRERLAAGGNTPVRTTRVRRTSVPILPPTDDLEEAGI